MNIRKATIADLPQLQKLSKASFQHEIDNFDDSLIKDWSESKEGVKSFTDVIEKGCLLILEDKEPVGFLAGYIKEAVSWRHAITLAEVGVIYIEKDYRRQGYGEKLMDEFETWAKSKNAKKLTLAASAQNSDAISFYEKAGFEQYELTLEKDL